MKKHSKIFLALLFSVTAVTSFAQMTDKRQRLYSSLPESIDIDKNIFINVLDEPVGKEVSLLLSTGFIFKGTVLSNFTKYNTIHTVMVRSAENPESIFQVTVIQSENNISYTGRIINKNAADGYEIKNNNGAYSLRKFESLNILDPCKL